MIRTAPNTSLSRKLSQYFDSLKFQNGSPFYPSDKHIYKLIQNKRIGIIHYMKENNDLKLVPNDVVFASLPKSCPKEFIEFSRQIDKWTNLILYNSEEQLSRISTI